MNILHAITLAGADDGAGCLGGTNRTGQSAQHHHHRQQLARHVHLREPGERQMTQIRQFVAETSFDLRSGRQSWRVLGILWTASLIISASAAMFFR
jgi:hypothetical protein